MRLVNKNVYKATFPLHEGRYDKDGPQGEKSDRRVKRVFSKVCRILFFYFKAFIPGVGSLEEFL